jgi:hypothetical protein
MRWLALLLLWVLPASGQPVDVDSTSAEPFVSFEAWPSAHRHYQHVYRAGADGTLSIGRVQLYGYVAGVFWQTDDSKVVGSPFNVENNMSQMVKYGATLRLNVARGFYLGPSIHRTEIHIVARRKDDFGYLDGWGSPAKKWRGEETACRKGVGCPSLAYQDAWGVAAGWASGGRLLSVRWLFHRWKTLTLAPRPLRIRAVWSYRRFSAELRAQMDLKERWRGDVTLFTRITGPLHLFLRAGRYQPDHKRSFDNIGIGLRLE